MLHIISNMVTSFLEMCCFRNKPDNRVSRIIVDMEELAQEEVERIIAYHRSKVCC